MVLRLWNKEYADAPNPIVVGEGYLLVAVQTESVANLTLVPSGVDIHLYTPDVVPPREALAGLVPSDRLLIYGGSNPTGIRHCEPYLYVAYIYGIQPLAAGNLSLVVHDQFVQRVVQSPSVDAQPSEPLVEVITLETAYAGGGRRCHLAHVFVRRTPARLRAIDLGGTAVLHLQTETPAGYRITVDYIDTDARIDLRRVDAPNQTVVNQSLRVIAWLH